MSEISYRDEVVQRVMRSLARLRAHGEVLPVRDARGVSPIYVALPEDRVGDVDDMVRTIGGSVNLIYADVDAFSIWAWDDQTLEGVESIDVHEESTMGMLMLAVDSCNGPSANLNLVRAKVVAPRELAYQF